MLNADAIFTAVPEQKDFLNKNKDASVTPTEQNQNEAVDFDVQGGNLDIVHEKTRSASYKRLLFGGGALLVLITLFGLYFVFTLQQNRNDEAVADSDQEVDNQQQLKDVLATHDENTAFYFAVSNENVLDNDERNGPGYVYLQNTLDIFRYDTKTKELHKIKENLSGNLFFDYDYVPRTAISPDGTKLIFADREILLFSPVTGKNIHYYPSGVHTFDENTEVITFDQTFQLGSPVFSPDSARIAYTIGLYNKDDRSLNVQVRVRELDTGSEEVILDDMHAADSGPMGKKILPLPVRWSEENELLLETRNLNQNNTPITISGFYVYDFAVKELRAAEFNYGTETTVEQCAAGTFFYCESTPSFVSRSPDNNYMVLEYELEDDEFSLRYVLLDLSLEGDLSQVAAKHIESCANGVWSPDGAQLACMSMYGEDSIFHDSSAIDFSAETLSIPLKYKVVDVQTNKLVAEYSEQMEIVTSDDYKEAIAELDEEIRTYNSQNERTVEEKLELEEEALAYKLHYLRTELSYSFPELIAWINSNLVSAEYSGSFWYSMSEQPTAYTLKLLDGAGGKTTFTEVPDTKITEQEEVIDYLQVAQVSSEIVDEVREGLGERAYSIERGIKIIPFGEVLLDTVEAVQVSGSSSTTNEIYDTLSGEGIWFEPAKDEYLKPAENSRDSWSVLESEKRELIIELFYEINQKFRTVETAEDHIDILTTYGHSEMEEKINRLREAISEATEEEKLALVQQLQDLPSNEDLEVTEVSMSQGNIIRIRVHNKNDVPGMFNEYLFKLESGTWKLNL